MTSGHTPRRGGDQVPGPGPGRFSDAGMHTGRALCPGLLKDYTRVQRRAPWAPSLSTSFRMLLLVRVMSAMYSGIPDCDETFNYWEPLHLLSHPSRPLGSSQSAFETWEYSPAFAIRSWLYLLQYLPVARYFVGLFHADKRTAFFAVRMTLAFTSSFCEASLVRSVAEVVNPRVARYMLALLLCSAGMYEASTAFLPSTFVMYTSTLALSFAFYPSRSAKERFPSNVNLPSTPPYRLLGAVGAFALGTLWGWPFALFLSVPFVFEEIFLASGLLVPTSKLTNLWIARTINGVKVASVAALTAVPLVLMDTLAYGRPVLVPVNIVVYNILSARRGAGPDLYGVEPWYFYLLNLTLNFGPILLLSIFSIPALGLTLIVDRRRLQPLELSSKSIQKGHPDGLQGSSEALLLTLRLLPQYLWMGLLTSQAHKEERFMFPAYPLLCFNAAVSIYLFRSCLERVYTKCTKSTYKASRTKLFSLCTAAIIGICALINASRILHVAHSYHAPMTILDFFSRHELPRVVAQRFPEEQTPIVRQRMSAGFEPVRTREEKLAQGARILYSSSGVEAEEPSVDLSPLKTNTDSAEQAESIRLCYGKEWYRFPTHYLVPDGVRVDFIKSEFNGQLPKHFASGSTTEAATVSQLGLLDEVFGWAWPWKGVTRAVPSGFNDMNLEEPDRYVDVDECDYIVDLDHPHRYTHPSAEPPPTYEPRYAVNADQWDRVLCLDFLDAGSSHAPSPSPIADKIWATVERAYWLPKWLRKGTNRYGDYCLLRTTRNDSFVAPNQDPIIAVS